MMTRGSGLPFGATLYAVHCGRKGDARSRKQPSV